jgi:hypothetical protein
MNSFARAVGLGAAVLVPATVAAQRRAGATEADVARPPAAATSADTVTIDSAILGQGRRSFVSLPASHAQTTRKSRG